MKVFLLAVLVALAAAAPVEDAEDAVELIVNGVPEGQALDIGDVVDIQLKEHFDGQVVATANLLHPFTAEGIAEAEVVAEPVLPIQIVDNEPAEDIIVPVPVPLPIFPELEIAPVEPIIVEQPIFDELPSPVVIPEPALPEILPPIAILPEPVMPEVEPEPVVVLPELVAPEVAEELPVPEPQIPGGEIYNDGAVQVQVNLPEDTGVLASLQSWFSMVLNYFSQDVQTTQQIV